VTGAVWPHLLVLLVVSARSRGSGLLLRSYWH
jgi:hypothetical protein